MSTPLDMQRTFALVGTGGCGKTSLAEMLLFNTGALTRMGAIEDGTTCLDYEPEEIHRRGSIQPAFATWLWNRNRHFLLDTPGDGNFTGDMEWLLKAVDGVLFVLDAVDGVRPLTKKLWNNVRAEKLPAMFVINKLDRDRANFQMAFDSLSALGVKTVALQVPIRRNGVFAGVVDVLQGKALMFADGGVTEAKIPPELADDVQLLHDVTVENIAESDEDLMEKYLEEGSLDFAELGVGLRAGVLSGELTPVLVCSAIENKGGKAVLDAVEALLPSPLERPAFANPDGDARPTSPDAPPACLVFKTLSDPFSGQLSLLRILSGTVAADSVLKNMRAEESERLGNLLYLTGKTQASVKDPVQSGAIVAVAKLKNTRSGDTLCDEKSPFALSMPKLPPQLITYALAPKEKGEEDKVYTAIQRLLDEDMTLKLARDEENGDILLSGMGQLHIELSVEKARRRYKIGIALKTPRVPYRETVRGKCQAQGRHKKQSGGRGQFGDCWIEMEGLPRGAGYVFEDAIVGGVIPRQYIPAIDKGIQEAAARGFLAGCQVVDYRVKVYDGSYHTVDSSEMAFKVAGSLAFKKAMESLKPVLLEPVVLLTISIPDENMGDVIGDLSSRRGKVLGSDSRAGLTEIKAHVPMSEVLRYAPDLRSMTGGQGFFTMEFAHYEEAPQPVAEKVIAEYRKSRAAE
ncbi:MAG: elongation factor G [Desulfovibrio sp.]|jgi:elongation factor G|nr:elongation factor G [Desulfovibrio sp.]